MVAATRAPYPDGSISCSPSSGFHHAHYDRNHGFCTFNGLIVAARKVSDEFNLEAVEISIAIGITVTELKTSLIVYLSANESSIIHREVKGCDPFPTTSCGSKPRSVNWRKWRLT